MFERAPASSRLSTQTAEALISEREAGAQLQTKDNQLVQAAGSDGGRPVLDEWVHFVIQIADPDSAHDRPCCVKCAPLTVAGAGGAFTAETSAEFVRWFVAPVFTKQEQKEPFCYTSHGGGGGLSPSLRLRSAKLQVTRFVDVEELQLKVRPRLADPMPPQQDKLW